MRLPLALALLIQISMAPAWGQVNEPKVLEQVNALHASGQTAEALTALDSSALKSESPGLYYYNRGVLLHALARYGLAVAAFEKARSLAAGRKEVEQGLLAARAELSRTLGPARLDPASNTFEKIGDEMPFDPFLIFFAGLTLLGILVIFARKKPWTSRVAILTGVNLLLLIVFLLWKHWMNEHPAAVVVDAVTVRSGPGNDYLDLANVDVGMKIRALENHAGWWKVRYQGDGAMGFVPAESLLLLNP